VGCNNTNISEYIFFFAQYWAACLSTSSERVSSCANDVGLFITVAPYLLDIAAISSSSVDTKT